MESLTSFFARRIAQHDDSFSFVRCFNKRNQPVPAGLASNFALAIVFHQFVHVVAAGAREIFALPVQIGYDVLNIHGSSDFNSSAGVQITGQS